ncbi:MAG: M24 family metallopeptidase [Thomasclavelia sp.]|nr:M24 family metallopeptidase [Thomasclavelia sp.]
MKPIKKQYQIINKILEERLNDVLPKVMNDSKADMWIICCKEYNEDPLFNALVPANYPTARRLCILAFVKDNNEIKKLSLCMPDEGVEKYYQRYYNFNEETQENALKRLLEEFKPKKIAINKSSTFATSDGLSLGCYNTLAKVIDPSLFISDDYLGLRLLENRTKTELEYLPEVVNIAYKIIDEVFSKNNINPGVTTCSDLEFLFREKVKNLGLDYWFEPDVDYQNLNTTNKRSYGVINYGDLIHCDFGIRYLHMCTDTQRLAYIAREDEDKLPSSLIKAMKDNDRFQDIVSECMEVGKTGNEVLKKALEIGNQENLKPILYSHPCNYFGHGPGPTIGLYNNQTSIPIRGEVTLINNTIWALELNTTSTYNNETWQMFTEETILFKDEKINYLYPGRKEIKLIK